MGFVYVISAGPDAQKIGIAADVDKRLAGLQSAHAGLLVVVHKEEVDNPRLVERYAHWLLREHRLRGEWFKIDPFGAARAIRQASEEVAHDPDDAALQCRDVKVPPPAVPFRAIGVGWIAVAAETAMEMRDRNAALCRQLLPKPRDDPFDTGPGKYQ